VLTLVLDASAATSQALLSRDGELIAAVAVAGRPLERLHPAIAAVAEQAGVEVGALERVAVVVGPGSWTGLHVAVTTAKTLAQVHDLPLVPISQLDALAWSGATHRGTIAALVDARRGVVYAATYAASGGGGSPALPTADGPLDAAAGEGAPSPINAPERCTVEQLAERLAGGEEPLLLVGDGAVAYAEQLTRLLPAATLLAPWRLPHPEVLARLGGDPRAEALTGAARFALEPLYLSEDGVGLTPYALPRC
jgi:tRNA threonylcarbamoyladenosine biosynthesis protein TsaB